MKNFDQFEKSVRVDENELAPAPVKEAKKNDSALENLYFLSNKMYKLHDDGVIDGNCKLEEGMTIEDLNGSLEQDQYKPYKTMADFDKEVVNLKLACEIFAKK